MPTKDPLPFPVSTSRATRQYALFEPVPGIRLMVPVSGNAFVSLCRRVPTHDPGTLQHGGRADFEPPLRPGKGHAGRLSERTMGYQDKNE